MSELEKHQIAVKFMSMVQNPEKFRHLERFVSNDDDRRKQAELDLPKAEFEKYVKLQKKRAAVEATID